MKCLGEYKPGKEDIGKSSVEFISNEDCGWPGRQRVGWAMESTIDSIIRFRKEQYRTTDMRTPHFATSSLRVSSNATILRGIVCKVHLRYPDELSLTPTLERPSNDSALVRRSGVR